MADPAEPLRRTGGCNWWRLMPVLLPLAVFNIAGIAGVDFGMHWDETEQLQNVRHSLATLTLLPSAGYTQETDPRLIAGDYGYPSMLYWISLASAGPEILQDPLHPARAELLDFVVSDAFRLRVRAVCVAISSLAVVWVYLIVLRLRGSALEALWAAMVLAGSWEVSYHSRWIATDTIVMQFGALCLLLCVRAWKSPAWMKWCRRAAVAAGLAAGTKYPAALLLLAVFAAAWSQGARGGFIGRLCLIAAATFVVTTPGAVLQPWSFIGWLARQWHHYGQGAHLGYNVAGPADHLGKMLIYEAIVLLSPQPIVAGALSALALIGVVGLTRQSWKFAIIPLVFPVVYVAYFAIQHVMIVRNLMVLTPFLAVLCAGGLAMVMKKIPWRGVRLLVAAAALAVVVFNCGFAIYAAWTIRQAGTSMNDDLVGLRDYMNDHPRTQFDLSAPILGLLAQLDPAAVRHAAPDHPDREVVVIESIGSDAPQQWPANTWNLAAAYFGPLDVNFNYYPTWERNRIVVLDVSRARELPMPRTLHDVAQP
jgi:4-amino-4-deoxy-L-arabinose transferase-like glycosyltransferase